MRTMLIHLCMVGLATADLRMASHPRNGFGMNQGGHRFSGTPTTGGVQRDKVFHRYMIPSVFAYQGLKYPGGQKYNNYDNFLRSNIDNEQDNRNFDKESGRDHLPFRTLETTVDTVFSTNRFDGQVPRPKDLTKEVKAGESLIVPLRWNNPHAAEMEVNLWIFEHGKGVAGGEHPIVIPIRKPVCSGEGHQDNTISFTIPKDFTKLGAKIPGFKGCNKCREPCKMCTLAIYSHSVESRQYALAFPIIVPGHEGGLSAADVNQVASATKDPWLDMSSLREICRPATDPDTAHTSAQPRWARLVSDVYTHSYMNSDFSPYSGQQQESISRNLQASAVNKMVTGNRGELGASILTSEASSRIAQLSSLEDRIYKNYEAIANKVIKTIGNKMATTGKLYADGVSTQLDRCFRCAEGGAVYGRRLETNTYIPSFQIPQSLQAEARRIVPSKYSSLITAGGVVQIYYASLTDLWPFFFVSHPIGIVYQEARLKNTLATFVHPTRHIKKNEAGTNDKGVYASTWSKNEFAESLGCPAKCLSCNDGNMKPIINGAGSTCVEGECSQCYKLFANYHTQTPPMITALAMEISKAGLPGGMGKDFPAENYPDEDGSPRAGRPPLPGQRPIQFTNSTLDLTPPGGGPTPAPTNAPTPAPTDAPTPAPTDAPTDAPTPAPTDGPVARRRRRRGGNRRRRRKNNGDEKPTRRRRGNRRRRRKGTKQASMTQKSMKAMRRGDVEMHAALDAVLGDVEPLASDTGC